MAHISTIKMAIETSNVGNIKITDTVARAIYYIKSIGRSSASIQDIAFVINNNARSEYHKVTEQQVKSVMSQLVQASKRNEIHRSIRNKVVSIDGYFYSF